MSRISLFPYRLAWMGCLAALSPVLAAYAVRDRAMVRRRLWPRRAQARRDWWWWHGASAGEVRALAAYYSAMRWTGRRPYTVVSATTSAGVAMWERVGIGEEGPHILPVDMLSAWNRVMPETPPRLVVLSESELWPAWLSWLSRRDVPVALVNARLSRKAANRLRSWRLIDDAVRRIYVSTQTEADARQFSRVGVPAKQIAVSGSLKWPRATAVSREAVRSGLGIGADEPVLVGGSIRRRELAPFVVMAKRIKERLPSLRCILAPRDAGECRRAERLAAESGLSAERWSEVSRAGRRWSADVLIVDTFGDLVRLYGAGTVAVIGGSWEPVGGHNPFEAAVYGIPLLYGPHMRQPGCERLEQTGQAWRISDWNRCAAIASALLADPPECSFPRYADPVCATWRAWQAWRIAPSGARVGDAEN